MSWTHCLLVSFCCIIVFVKVEGQATGEITQIAEEVVASAGASANLNCTVSSPADIKPLIFVEWAFLNATGGAKSLTKDCGVREENNDVNGKEKFEMFCEEGASSTDTKYSLRVNMLSFPDNGWYECRVRLSNEQLPTSTMQVKLTVLSPPKIQTSATRLSVDAFINSTVSISCSAEGVPGPNVTWGRANGKPLPAERSYSIRNLTSTIVTKQTLTIINVTKDDTGTYRCSADNNIRPPDDFFSRITVQYKPTVVAVEPSYGSNTGENTRVMMWCRVEGHPRPEMNWYAMTSVETRRYRDGLLELDDTFFSNAKQIVTDEKFSVEQKIMTVGSLSTRDSMFYSLTLHTVEPGDMVYFVCRAENKHGTASAAVQLYRINTLADERSISRSNMLRVSAMSMLVVLLTFIFTS